jgi:V8-like Glu-specific endopeptidase
MSKATIPTPSFHRCASSAMLALTVFGCIGMGLAQDQVNHMSRFAVLKIRAPQPDVDFVNAKPMPLPINDLLEDSTQAKVQALLSTPDVGAQGYEHGAIGSGQMNPVFLGKPAPEATESNVKPEDWGTSDHPSTTDHPFTTVRADLYALDTQSSYPYRAAGKLFFNIGADTYWCSASLIKRGIVVTAAHCAANYGHSQFYSGWRFVPAYRDGAAPFGVWSAQQVWIEHTYYNGTDGCTVYGIVCPDDVAVIILNTQSGDYPGTAAGWFGYWYGGGFTSSGLTQITQLGYSAGLDNGLYLERTDSYGYISASDSNNTIIGSNMNAGSYGGPWIVNFGFPSTLTGETNGSFSHPDVIVGVASWGYTSNAPKEQGASPFTSNNIKSLLNSACAETPAACK